MRVFKVMAAGSEGIAQAAGQPNKGRNPCEQRYARNYVRKRCNCKCNLCTSPSIRGRWEECSIVAEMRLFIEMIMMYQFHVLTLCFLSPIVGMVIVISGLLRI